MSVLAKFKLDQQIAVVTGGAGLYGKLISTALAEAGATVLIASRDGEKCEQVASNLRQQGLLAYGHNLDLSAEVAIQQFVDQVVAKYGRIDTLVNNAVSREGFKNLEAVTKSEWEASQQVNSTGMMLLTKEVVPHMCEQRSGSIINIGSIQGVVGPNFTVYGDTGMTSPINYTYDKWAMVGFTKWLANYYGKYNVRANCISPGGYGPGVAESFGENAFVDNYKRLTPMGRFADEEDIKGPIVFLASAAASYVTGHNLVVDGGWTSW